MKTRIQLANGYIAGSLTEDEKRTAEANPVVMSMVKSIREPVKETKKVTHKKEKGEENA